MKLCVMEVSMGANLVAGAAPVFSESARRPVPGHRDAARDPRSDRRPGRGLRALAVLARRLAEHLAEGPAEGAQAAEADVEADLRHRAVGLAQHRHRALEPPALEVAMRRLAEHVAEAADEVRPTRG